MNFREISTVTIGLILIIGITSLIVAVFPSVNPPEISIFADPFGSNHVYIRLDGRLYTNDTFEIITKNYCYILAYNTTYGISKQELVERNGDRALYKIAEFYNVRPESIRTSRSSIIIKALLEAPKVRIVVWDVFARKAEITLRLVNVEWAIKLIDEDYTFHIIMGFKIPEGTYTIIIKTPDGNTTIKAIQISGDSRIMIEYYRGVVADFKVYVEKKSIIWAYIGIIVLIIIALYTTGYYKRILHKIGW